MKFNLYVSVLDSIYSLHFLFIYMAYCIFNHELHFHDKECCHISKVKCTLVQALGLCTGRTAHTGSRCIALLFYEQQY
jgi:hypothetical protein